MENRPPCRLEPASQSSQSLEKQTYWERVRLVSKVTDKDLQRRTNGGPTLACEMNLSSFVSFMGDSCVILDHEAFHFHLCRYQHVRIRMWNTLSFFSLFFFFKCSWSCSFGGFSNRGEKKGKQ